MAKFQKVKISTETALVAAVLAYKQNGNTIVRDNAGGKSDNKQLINEFITRGEKPTDDEIKEAQAVKDSLLQRIMLNELKGVKSNEFLLTIVNLLKSDTIYNTQYGLIAWAPKLNSDIAKQDDQRSEMLAMGAGSKYVGQVGKRINLNIEILTCRHLPQYNSFVHQAITDDGNLITFFNKSKIPSGKIQARVKAHRADFRLSNAFVTTVNYVKEIKNGS